jgi:hypothetical protein
MKMSMLTLAIVLCCALPANGQTALQLIEGNWSDLTYACEHPGRIAVFGDRLQFAWPRQVYRATSKSGGEYTIGYSQTLERVTSSQGNSIDTVVDSTDADKTRGGARYHYELSTDKLLIHNYQSGKDGIHSRCK